MKKILLFVVAAGIWFSNVAKASEVDWSLIYKKALPAVPVLRTRGGICSGALIAPNQILTAAHCVHHLRPVTLQWFVDGKVVSEQKARLVRMNKKTDLAVLELEGVAKAEPLKLARPEELRVGSEHATIGHPFGLRGGWGVSLNEDLLFNFTKGMVTKINPGKNYLTDMSVSPGNSGGPVLNERAEITGVVSAKVALRNAGSIGLLAHPTQIQDLLKQEAREYTFRDARGSFDLGVKEVYVGIEHEGRSIFDHVFAVDLRFWFADRILAGVDRSVSSSVDDIEYRGYFAGYRWYWESSEKMPFFYGAGAKWVTYRLYDERGYVLVYLKALGLDFEAGINPGKLQEGYFSFGLAF